MWPGTPVEYHAADGTTVRVAARPIESRVHTVRRGESLSVIAARYDVSVKQLQSWNALGRRGRIYAGQKLRVAA